MSIVDRQTKLAVNELNPDREKDLRQQGFRVTDQDASTHHQIQVIPSLWTTEWGWGKESLLKFNGTWMH
ncbi:hypothetical protein ACSYAD_20730 [Acaryochloris marina NIES-2412]|uniref:hypothetical protein n=1 Tax=Acaryochloris marina TaxID=155978 RepID=UPI004059DC3A